MAATARADRAGAFHIGRIIGSLVYRAPTGMLTADAFTRPGHLISGSHARLRPYLMPDNVLYQALKEKARRISRMRLQEHRLKEKRHQQIESG
jgi:hypothetical protein